MAASKRAKSLLSAWGKRGLLRKEDVDKFLGGETSADIIWQGARATNGYDQVRIDGKIHAPHRVMAEAQFGNIPKDKIVGHTCNKKHCVNPMHLKLISVAQNTADAWSDGLYNKKEFGKKVSEGMKKAKKKK